MGAGILPISVYNNKIYFLFGKERDRPNETARGWADFGGGHEKNETPLNTASREGAEELSGFLGNKNKIKNLLNKKKMIIKTNDNTYTTYIVPIEYDVNLPKYFNNQIGFLKTYINKEKLYNTTMYEKDEIKWFSYNMIKKSKTKFRPFYREIIDKIVKNINEIKIKLKLKKSLKNIKKTKKTKKIFYTISKRKNNKSTKKNILKVLKN